MSYSKELERGVLLARRAVSLQHLRSIEALTALLYHHWYLGRPDQPAPRSPQTGPVWQAWQPAGSRADAVQGEALRVFVASAPGTGLHALAVVTKTVQTWDSPWHIRSHAMRMAVPTVDSTSLTLPLGDARARRRELEAMALELAPFTANQTPAMTLRLGRGVAAGQLLPPSTHGAGSYGWQRCQIVARSVLDSQRHHHREQISRAMTALARAGIDPRQPYRLIHPDWDRCWGVSRASA